MNARFNSQPRTPPHPKVSTGSEESIATSRKAIFKKTTAVDSLSTAVQFGPNAPIDCFDAKAYVFGNPVHAKLIETDYGCKVTMKQLQEKTNLSNGKALDVLFTLVWRPVSYNPKVIFNIFNGEFILYELIGGDNGHLNGECYTREPGDDGRRVLTLHYDKCLLKNYNTIIVKISEETFKCNDGYSGSSEDKYMKVKKIGNRMSVCYKAHELVANRCTVVVKKQQTRLYGYAS